MPSLEFASQYRDALKKCHEGICEHEVHTEQIICPRCRNGHTVRGNYRDMCDFCCLACLEAAEDLVVMKRLTQEEADELVNGIKAAQKKWQA